MTDSERIEAVAVCLRLKVFIFKICIFHLTMTQRNSRILAGRLRSLLRCLDYLPRILDIQYLLEVEIPCNDITDNCFRRRGGWSEIPLIFDNIKLIEKFFRKCSEAEVYPELLTSQEAKAYEEIKRELNFLVKNLFQQVQFISSINPKLPELIPVATQIEKVDMELCCMNNKVFIQTTQILPSYVSQRLAGCVPPLPDTPIVWVEDPLNKFLMPFTTSQQELGLVRDLLSGRLRPCELPGDVAQIFYMAKIVLKADPLSNNPEGFNFIQQATESLQRDSYLVVRGILNPLQIAAYRYYYRSMESNGLLLVDSSTEHRLFKHNESLAKFIHVQLEAFLNKILLEKVKKSYCYVRAHKAGAVLKKHIDRPQCEWNISLIFDMGPDRDHEVPWPIFLEIDGETKEVLLQMGDALLYQGTKVPHWRNELPMGYETTAVFFHFVNENFQGDLN